MKLFSKDFLKEKLILLQELSIINKICLVILKLLEDYKIIQTKQKKLFKKGKLIIITINAKYN